MSLKFDLPAAMVGLAILLWLIIGSSARIDPIAGLVFLLFFVSVAVLYGKAQLARDDVVFWALFMVFVVIFGAKNEFTVQQILYLVVEFTAFMFIFRRPGATTSRAFLNLIVAYAAFSIFWKLFIDGYGFFAREHLVFNGVIKFGMICAMGYALVLLTPRAQMRPSRFELVMVTILLLGVVTSLSRTPLGFVVLVTGWYLLRKASLSRWIMIGAGLAVLAVPISQSRLFYVSGGSGSLLERISLARAEAWQEAMAVLAKDPVFGPGGAAYRAANSWDLEYPHNMFLEVLINTGVLGLALFLLLVAMRLRAMNAFNYTVLVTAMTSGDIFLWGKIFFVGPKAVTAPTPDTAAPDPGRHPTPQPQTAA